MSVSPALSARKPESSAPAKVQFALTGFTQEGAFRVFAFEGIAADFTRVALMVRVDLALARRYGIPIQELPLLCRGLLEQHTEIAASGVLTFTEEDLRSRAASRAAAKEEAARKKEPPRRHSTENLGAAWRVSHL